jgi:hypothetical protein
VSHGATRVSKLHDPQPYSVNVTYKTTYDSREADLNKWVNVQPRSPFCYSTDSILDFGVSGTAIDFAKVGISRGNGNGHAVASKTCRRITLKK